ncbi:MAG: putative phage terminase large subunit-like protein [Paracoccaceae bacterium]|jgi:predicted phage terminase large subunit-like protein
MNDINLVDAILRESLSAFIHKAFQTVSPGTTYRHNWHIDAISYELERCSRGENRRLIISQPPRSLKSISSSVAFVAWSLGHNPSLDFICVSYSQDLADELALQFRRVVQSEWYQRVFPHMKIKRDTAHETTTTEGGGRFATSTGGTLTGRGADIILVDDPMKAADAASDTERQNVIDWYSNSLITRLNDQGSGRIIVVMQRLHEEDLAGYLLAQESWANLELPAIADAEQTIRVGPAADDIIHRSVGDILHPERMSEDDLKRLKSEMGSLVFSAQYQQRPIPREGNLVKRRWFRSYSLPLTETPDQIVQSWDIAVSKEDKADWSVCTTWAVFGRNYYLIDVWRDRLHFPRLKRKVITLQKRYKATAVLIERNGLGESLVQDLRDSSPDSFPGPIGIRVMDDKHVRLEAQSPTIEARQVFLPEDAPWLDMFLSELLGFPNSRHDDQVDSVSQFLSWIKSKSRNKLPLLAVGGGKNEGIRDPFGNHIPPVTLNRW